MYLENGIVDKLILKKEIISVIIDLNTLTKDMINYLNFKESSWLVRMNNGVFVNLLLNEM